ncbi:MAG: ABC transporter ATP-binding protein [Pseudomonadota bacterium]
MLEKVSYKDIFKFSWSYWKRQKVLGFWALFFFTMSTLVDVVFPTYIGRLVDHFSGDFQANQIEAKNTIIAILTLSFVFFAARWTAFQFYNRFETKLMHDISIDAMEKVQRFSTNWHSNNFAGATVRKITRARSAFEMFEDSFILGIWPAVIILFGISGMLILAMPWVGLFVFTIASLYVCFSVYITIKYLTPRYTASATADTKVGAVAADIVTCNPTVKAFGSENREDAVFSSTSEEWLQKTLRAYLSGNTVDFVRSFITFTMLAGMLGLTFWYWREGIASAGDITMVVTSFFMMNGYLREIGRFVENIQKSISDMEDVVYFWKTDIAVQDKLNAKSYARGKGDIVFNDITFGYKNQGDPLYKHFSLHIRPSEKVALVGHSGSGKSTFVKLLQRLHDVQNGEICVDNQNIADITQSSLRQAISLVPQDPILFHRTLSDNIAYAKPDASYDDIIAAAKKAYAHEFIEGLPQGYDTLVGERGIKLSGGERQRVAIARAILSDAPILILDEATSSLDSISEHYIQMALKELMKGRTTITIAHRLSTIKNVDRILVFDNGHVVEQGTHAELLTNEESHYKKLYEMQVLGFVD